MDKWGLGLREPNHYMRRPVRVSSSPVSLSTVSSVVGLTLELEFTVRVMNGPQNNIYLLNTYCVPGTDQGSWKIIVWKRLLSGKDLKAWRGRLSEQQKTIVMGTSLVVQWLRIHRAMQGTQVESRVEERRSHIPQSHYACAPDLRNPHTTTEHSTTWHS